MNKKIVQHIIILMIAASPAIYFFYIYPALPQTIPTHWGLHGADRFTNKSNAWIGIFIQSSLSLLVYFLIQNLHKIDPKKNAALSTNLLNKISIGVVVFINLVSITIIIKADYSQLKIERFIFLFIGIFFSFLGNLMYSVKPNYFVGIRTPWALENENNWRATHQLSGRLWFFGGIILAIITIAIPIKTSIIIFSIGTALLALVPIIYSYLYFKKNK